MPVGAPQPPVVNWYERDVILRVAEATEEMLRAVAFQVEGQTKINIEENGQVDTGFMRSSVYVSGLGVSSYGETLPSGAYMSGKTGESGERVIMPEVLDAGEGMAVAVGAEYAIHQEMRDSFLYRGAEMVAGAMAEATMESVARRVGL